MEEVIEKADPLEELKDDVASIRKDVSTGLWCFYMVITVQMAVNTVFWLMARFKI